MTKVKIVKYDVGPFMIEGEFKLIDGEGKAFSEKQKAALCRCCHSSSQPFCDGTHRSTDYREASQAR